MAKARIVPFRRELELGDRGPDVRAVKRALAAAGVYKMPKAGQIKLMGPFAVRALKRFQKDHRLDADGVYGPNTHRALAPHFDGFGAWLMGLQKRPSVPGMESTSEIRDRVVAAMLLLYHNAPAVHYTQGSRRMEGVTRRMRPPVFPRYADCSSAATWAYYVAGAADPNGAGYNGTGYTGTLSRKGRVVDLAHARPGDLVFYGRGWPWHHVAVYCGHGRVLSHGSEGGPYLLAVDYRGDRGEIRSYLS